MAAINKDDVSDVWILRHGERIDETPAGQKWYCETEKTRCFDPPLTENGKAQAREAAVTLRRLVGEMGGGGGSVPLFHAIYCSPMQRCLSTASEVAALLGPVPDGVVVVPGLAECAAAAREARGGVGALIFLGAPAMRTLCPAIASDAACWAPGGPETYVAAVAWAVVRELARPARAGAAPEVEVGAKPPPPPPRRRARVLIVCHREGIRDLMAQHLRLPYCALACFAASPAAAPRLAASPSFEDFGLDFASASVKGGSMIDDEEAPSARFSYELTLIVEPSRGQPVPGWKPRPKAPLPGGSCF
jgi:broad specificity phosphatase PhoE